MSLSFIGFPLKWIVHSVQLFCQHFEPCCNKLYWVVWLPLPGLTHRHKRADWLCESSQSERPNFNSVSFWFLAVGEMFSFTSLGCSFLSTHLPLMIPPNNSQYIYVCVYVCLSKVEVAQSCPALCDPSDCTVHGILQARILEWVAFPFSGGSSQPRD